MLRSALILSVLLNVVACSTTEETVQQTQPVLSLSSINTDLIYYIEEWASLDTPSKPLIYLSNDPQFMTEQLSANWCGDAVDRVLLVNALDSLCDDSEGYRDGQYCVKEDIKAPIFAYSFEPSQSAVCDDLTQHDLMVTVPFNPENQAWLDHVRSLGFLTHKQREMKLLWDEELAQRKSHREKAEALEILRTEQRAFYQNKFAIEGKYNHVVCKLDTNSGLLMNKYIGRVLATFDNEVQVQLIDYTGRLKAPDFQKNKVVSESYALWEICDV